MYVCLQLASSTTGMNSALYLVGGTKVLHALTKNHSKTDQKQPKSPLFALVVDRHALLLTQQLDILIAAFLQVIEFSLATLG